MTKLFLNKLLMGTGILVFLLLLVCSYKDLEVQTHFLEFVITLLVLVLYVINKEKCLYLLGYLFFTFIGQIIFILYITDVFDSLNFSIFGGYIYLLAYFSIIIYMSQKLVKSKLDKLSFFNAGVIILLFLFLLYQIHNMIVKNTAHLNGLDAFIDIIYVYLIVVSLMTSLGFIYLSVKVNKEVVCLCLALSSILLSEYLQSYQFIYYKTDTIGWINATDKFLTIIALVLFYKIMSSTTFFKIEA